MGLSSAAFMVLFTVQFMAWSFVFKLGKIGKSAQCTSNADTIRKYAVLNIVSISFTTIYAVFGVICVSYRSSMNEFELVYLEQTVLAVVVVIDVFLDSICMTLSLNVNERYYHLCCFLCTKGKIYRVQVDTANGFTYGDGR